MWKTVALRMTKAKSELEQMGEDTEYMVKSTAELQGLIKGITGFDILEADQKTLKSTYDIVLNIGKVWGSLSDLDRNSLLYALAGTRQSNALAAALTNIEDMQAAYEAAENSAGSARKEQEKYTRSIQYSLDVLKATGEELSSNLFDSQGMKNTVDMATKLLELINSLTKSVGGLGTALTAIMGYKGFKSGFGGMGIESFLTKTITGFKDFFTQRQLSSTAITAGITQNDIQILTKYDQALKLGITDTTALNTSLHGISEEGRVVATAMQAGTVQIEELTVATHAAQLGMSLLNAAMSALTMLAFSAVLTSVIKWVKSLSEAEAEAAEKAKNLSQKTQELATKHRQEFQELTELIEKYKELYKEEGLTNLEKRTQLREIQQQITTLVGQQADNIDLVNGKLDDELQKLQAINNQALEITLRDSKNEYRTSLSDYQTWSKTRDKESKPFNRFFALDNGVSYSVSDKKVMKIGVGEISLTDQIKALNEILDGMDELEAKTGKQDPAYAYILNLTKELEEYSDTQRNAIDEYLDAFVTSETNLRSGWATTMETFYKARQEIIDEVKNDATISKAVEEGTLSDLDVEQYVDDYLATTDKFNQYYQNQKSQIEDITFSYSDYKDQINEVTKTLSSLSSVYEKLGENKMSDSDLMSLFDEFPELSAYAGDMDELQRQVKALATQKAEPLLTSLRNLAKTVKDPEQKEQLEGLVHTLEKMAGLSSGIEETAKAVNKITASDYIKFEEDKIQDIIDKLEEEKSAQDEILESLKSQKEELEEIVSDYEKTADVVGKYIDRTQIKPLENQKSEIEEYYNAEIEKLKEENEERSRNIELQEKQNALANARKTKKRVYTETQGYVWKNDESAITKAEKELSDLQNSMAIEDLEKQRDSEVKSIEEQIKAWENYKDQWKEQVEAITEADEELIASKVLGADWHEKVADQDISVMENYGAEYASYNNQLKNQVSVEITNLEKVIKERDTEIDDWKDYKNELSKLNTDITDSNKEYLDNLNQFVLDENSTWQDRIDHMKRNVEIIRALNAKSEGTSVTSAESDIYAVVQDGEVKDWYYTQQDAENAKRKIAENMAKSKVGGNVPQGVLESIIQGFMTRIRVQKYAKGGVNTTTGFAWLDGSRNQSEVVFNSAQAKELYEMARGQNFANEVKSNIMDSFKNYLGKLRQTAMNTTNAINISFDGANINAESYESFKDYMDRYTNDLFMKIQTGR